MLPSFHLEQLRRWGIFEEDKKEAVNEICAIAGGEYALSKTLDGIEEGWDTVHISYILYINPGTGLTLNRSSQLLTVLNAGGIRSGRLQRWRGLIHLG